MEFFLNCSLELLQCRNFSLSLTEILLDFVAMVCWCSECCAHSLVKEAFCTALWSGRQGGLDTPLVAQVCRLSLA